MFKLEAHPRIYYFETEAAYDNARQHLKYPEGHHKDAVLCLSTICIDVTDNKVIKHRDHYGVKNLIESMINIEEPRQEITIVVNGRCGSGKTRIAALLNKFLGDIGFYACMEFKEERPSSVYATLDEAIEYIKPKVKILITENTHSRSGMVQ